MKRIERRMMSVFLLLSAMLLFGCAKQKPKLFVPPPQKPSLNQVRSRFIHQLEKNGVQVIHVGETVRIVLRDDFMFLPDSANIRESYKPVLTLVAKLMRSYDKISVKVSAYTDNQGKKTYLQALSTRQAEVVADFLWYHKADARLLYAVGSNKTNPVSWNGNENGRSVNRRVEVSFRYAPRIRGYE